MSWKYDYIIARAIDSKLTIQFCTDSLKNARFWLNLAGEPGDCLFLSPQHKNNSSGKNPEYNCHKDSMGFIDFHLNSWLKNYFRTNSPESKGYSTGFPEELFQFSLPEKTETTVLIFDEKSVSNMSRGAESVIGSLIGAHWNDLASLLSSPVDAITGSLIQPGGSDNFLFISVGTSVDWPCAIRIESDFVKSSSECSRMLFSVNAKI